MQTVRKCAKCGTEIGGFAPESLCPGCMLEDGFSAKEEPTILVEPEGQAGPPPAPSPAGESARFFGDYELLETIAQGGMGIVYKARQVKLDRLVALKTLLLGAQASPESIKRFQVEVLAAASLQHPNIVAIHEVGFRDGQHFFTMDFVNGPTLAVLAQGKPLPGQRAARYIQAVAEAIHYAHERGILHRDLKPSNVLVDENDQPRVTDFGLAKRLESESSLTLSGQVVGTPSFLPPEQAGGRRQQVGRASDVYALGAILYYLLTGRPPFVGESLETTLGQVQNQPPISPRLLNGSVPRDLETVCLKCLEKEPSRRYATAKALAEELQRFQRGEPIQARPIGPTGKVWRWCRRKPVVAGLGAGLVLALVLGMAGVTWQWQRARQIAQRETHQRQLAEANAYAADMNEAQQALLADDLGKAQRLLARYRLGTGLEHLRGFEWRYLAAEARGDMVGKDNSSSSAAFDAAFSPDGRTLAIGRHGGAVELWDVGSLTRTEVLETDAGLSTVFGVAFAPGTNLLAVARPGGIIRLWQLEPRRIIGELFSTEPPRSDCPLKCLSFSSDRRYLASYQWDGARVWDLRTLQLAKHYPRPGDLSNPKGRVCFAPGGHLLALGEFSGQIRIVDVEADREVLCIAAHQQAITSLAFSPDGKLLASASGFRTDEIRLWNAATGEFVGSLAGHRYWVSALHFSADGRRLYSASGDQTIRLWDVAVRRPERTLRGHRDEIWTLAFSERWTNFVSGGRDGTLAWWSLEPPRSNELRQELLTDAWDLGHLDRDSVALCRNKERPGPVALWRPGDSKELAIITALGTNNRVLATAPARELIAASSPGIIRIWSRKSASVLTNLVTDAAMLRFSKNGEVLLSVEDSGHFTVWDAQKWVPRFSHAETNEITTGCLSPDGRLLVLVCSNRRLTWWDTLQGRQIADTLGPRQGYSSLAFSPDGKTLAAASWDGTIVPWDTRTHRPTLQWKPDLMAASTVVFSPDGTRLATAHSNGSAARLWDVKTQRELITLQAPGEIFEFLEFSPDGSALLSAERPGYAYVWRPPSFADLDATAEAQSTAGKRPATEASTR